jgi:hypothetical protein
MAVFVGCGDMLQRFIHTVGTGLMATLPGISPYVALGLQGWSLASTANFLHEGLNEQRLNDPQLAMTGDPATAKVSKVVWGALGLAAGLVGIVFSLHQMQVIHLGRHAAALGKVSVAFWLLADVVMLYACARSLRIVWNQPPQTGPEEEAWRTRVRFIAATIVAHLMNVAAACLFFFKPHSHAPLALAAASTLIQGGYSFYFGIRQWLHPPRPTPYGTPRPSVDAGQPTHEPAAVLPAPEDMMAVASALS